MLKYNFWNSAAGLKCILLCPAVVGVGDAGDSLGGTNAETVFDPPPVIEIVISDVKASYLGPAYWLYYLSRYAMMYILNIWSMAVGLQTNMKDYVKILRNCFKSNIGMSSS